jgi:hypothetical protein
LFVNKPFKWENSMELQRFMWWNTNKSYKTFWISFDFSQQK